MSRLPFPDAMRSLRREIAGRPAAEFSGDPKAPDRSSWRRCSRCRPTREPFLAVVDYIICGDRDDLHRGQDSDGANAVTVAYRLHGRRCCASVDTRGGGRVLATIELLSDEEEER